MSTDRELYVGPYLECKFQMAATTQATRSCENQSCPNHRQVETNPIAQHCFICGSAIVRRDRATTQPAVDQWDIMADLKERLVAPPGRGYDDWMRKNRTHIYVPNIQAKGRAWESIDANTTSFFLTTPTPEQQQAAFDRFQKVFEREINVMHVTYGTENVRTKWGVIFNIW